MRGSLGHHVVAQARVEMGEAAESAGSTLTLGSPPPTGEALSIAIRACRRHWADPLTDP